MHRSPLSDIFPGVPRLWDDTIDAHRAAVKDAILEATAALALKNGLASVSMSDVAVKSGIGRATLYKYFPDVESILHAWHERQVAAHLAHLVKVRDAEKAPAAKLRAVLQEYALITHERHDVDLAALLHRGESFAKAHDELTKLVREIIAAGAKAGVFRGDVPPDELASYCLHALTAAGAVKSKKAATRLVDVTLSALARSR